jgi:membrane protease YdiL (CAAX protease family)
MGHPELSGAAFAFVYEWRQSLVPGIVMHSAQNSLAFLLINLLYS